MAREKVKPAYMGPTDLARYLGIGRATLGRWRRDPHAKFPPPHYIRVGRTRQPRARWSIAAVDRWVRKRHRHDPSIGCEIPPGPPLEIATDDRSAQAQNADLGGLGS